MIRWSVYLIPILLVLASTPAPAQEIGFIENFALAEDRAEVLKQLVPGTQEYYYFHALHYQTSGQLDKVDELLKPWITRFGETQQVNIIRNRQALLRYDESPEATYRFLQDRLQLNFNHQRTIPSTERTLPTSLDPKLIAADRLLEAALRRYGDTTGVSDTGLENIDASKLDSGRRRHLLSRLSHPDFPELVSVIVQDLREKDSGGFGSLQIHAALTIQQLEACLESIPKLIDELNFVNIYLSKLLPGDDVNWRANRDEHRAYLLRLYEFTSRLNPVFNSLKACVIFRRLELDQLEGQYDRELFLEYLQLPRNVGYVNPQLLQDSRSQSHLVNLAADYQNQIQLGPILSDENLVADYLHQLLEKANGYDAFRPYIRDEFLKKQYATVKILNGLGNSEQWASMLSPEDYQALLSRVDLDFVPTNREFFGDDDVVEIELHTKNIQKLIVRGFEINSFNFYRKHGVEVDTDVNLDGLVPNFEKTFEYDDEPVLRKRRSFTFDELKNPGLYVVDFIGGGKSSRALIRRGQLSMIAQPTVAGQQFRVFDQNRKRVNDASLWIAGHKYQADESGVITAPFSNQPGDALAIISHNGFSSLQSFAQVSENYSLNAAMYVDRESLLFNQTASLLIRPSLTVAGVPTSVKLLTDVQVAITSVDQSGISSTKRMNELKLTDDAETTCEFVVPPRLKSIHFELTAKVENISRNEEQSLSTARSFELNQIDTSDEIQDVHLMPSATGYILETLGKTGEKRIKQAVRVQLKHRNFVDPVLVDLRSDENGQVELGQLEGIETVEVTLAGGSSRSWPLNRETITRSASIHMPAGETIQIPALAGLESFSRSDVSLFEKRQGQIVADHFERISLRNGMFELENLPAGDYEFRVKQNQQSIKISIVDGKRDKEVVIGNHRRIELRDIRPLVIEQISPNRDQIDIRIRNGSSLARVHVIASRYQPRFGSFEEFSRVRGIEPWIQQTARHRSAYMAGRSLGDEYQYILDRRYAKKYPGNMLTRPSILMTPWSIRETTNEVETLAEGDDFVDAGTDGGGKSVRGEDSQRLQGSHADFANLNFLDQTSIILANLKPDNEGIVTIDREQLKGLHHIRVVAVDADSTAQQVVNFTPADMELRDLRLATGLNPSEHYSQSKQIEIMNTGDELTIEDLVSGRFQYFDDIGDVFRLYLTLNPNTKLTEFEFLLNWSEKSASEKLTLYSKFACHELNFYLFKKDKPFFDAVVKPHVGYKSEQGMIDRYLTNDELELYSNPWHYSRLNVFEKILLSQRLENRTGDIVRSINDQYLMNPTKREFFDSLYDTSIRTDALFPGEILKRQNSDEPHFAPNLSMIVQDGVAPAPADAATGREAGGAGGFGESPRAADLERKAGIELSMDSSRELSKQELSLGQNRRAFFGKELDADKKMGPDLRFKDIGLPSQEDEQSDSEEGAFDRRADDPFEEQFAAAGKKLIELRDKSRTLYRRLSPTQEWVEQQYYQLPLDQQKSELVATNRFWQEYSNHRGDRFLSPWFPESHRSLTEMLLAMAVIDLPEKAPEHEFDYVDNRLNFTAGGPLIALHQQFRPAIFERQNTTVLIAENFFQKDDRFRSEDGVQYDKFVSERFYAHTLYGAQVVLTNPTSTPQAVDLLVQIPNGSVAASASQETRSLQVQLDAFSTRTFEYHFYFPMAGKFSHYPAHVSRDEQVLAVAENIEFIVIDQPIEIDRTSWEFVSQNGSDDEVIDFVKQNNVLRYDLDRIAFRMQDDAFFQRVIDTLRERYTYSHVLWSYGVHHQNESVSQEFLQHEDRIAGQVGLYFQSPLLEVLPYERNWYQHREYDPLVNARFHQLGNQRRILNPEFNQHYQKLLEVLSNRNQLDSEDHLAVTYYMLLQDRIDEAIQHFGKVESEQLAARIQYDYCSAYLDFFHEDLNAAAEKAKQWSEYPVDLWRNRFKNMLAQIEEIRGGSNVVVDERDAAQLQAQLSSRSPSFNFEIESGNINISTQNISEIRVNIYEMDIELMFSRSPFAEKNLDGFSIIRPNASEVVAITSDDQGKGVAEFTIPADLSNRNVLVEINAGDQIQAQPYFANSMSIQAIEKFGQLKVADEDDKPLSQVYVKVYSQTDDGQIRFHKDGYTDLRGRFDYVSQSNNPLDQVRQYSVLILSPENGALTRQLAPPAE